MSTYRLGMLDSACSIKNASMCNQSFNLTRGKTTPPRVASSARLALHFSMLLVFALFQCAVPSVGLFAPSEFEAPIDQDEASVEAALSTQARSRSGQDHMVSPPRLPVRFGQNPARHVTDRTNRCRRDLPNHLLVPLRC